MNRHKNAWHTPVWIRNLLTGCLASFGALPGFVPFAQAAVDPLDTWHVRSLPGAPITEDLESIAYGKGLFVAGGDDGSIFTSPDGVDWHRESSPTTHSIDDLIFAFDRFVAVGGSQVLMTSADGHNWTSHSAPMSGVHSLIFDGSRLVNVAAGGFVHVSTNGVNWVSTNSVPTTTVTVGGIAFGNGTYVEAGYKSGTKAPDLFSSSDLKTWTPRTSNVTQNLVNVVFGLGMFVAVGQKGTLITSPDGVVWTPRTTAHTGFIWDVATDGRTLVAAAQWGRLLTSTDGAGWKVHETGLLWHLKAVAYGNGTFVAVGWDGQVVQSDPVAQVPPGENIVLSAPLRVGNQFTFRFSGQVGTTYQVQASSDLKQWVPVGSVLCTQSPMPYSELIPAFGAMRSYRVVRP